VNRVGRILGVLAALVAMAGSIYLAIAGTVLLCGGDEGRAALWLGGVGVWVAWLYSSCKDIVERRRVSNATADVKPPIDKEVN